MKTLTSVCQKVWLFDVSIEEASIKAGLACFLPQASSWTSFEHGSKKIEASLPLKAVNSGVPVRITNARLFLR